MALLNLQRKVAKLEGGGGAPPNINPEWADDFGDFDLLRDPSWRQWCSLDQFVIGRAALLARMWRLLDGYAYWSERHKEPDWWRSEVWRGKTPDWKEQIAREQRLHCPKENRKSMVAFVDWLYGDAPKREPDRPWEWCQRDVGSLYHWPDYRFHQMGLLPLVHAMAIASAIWLADDLSLSPAQVQASASAHYCAFKWRDLSHLREVELPKQPITGTSPPLRLKEMAAAASARGIPVNPQPVNRGDGLELLELLMCVPSGCGGPHDHEMIYPSLTVLEP